MPGSARKVTKPRSQSSHARKAPALKRRPAQRNVAATRATTSQTAQQLQAAQELIKRRNAQLKLARKQSAQRDAELAVISTIQHGLASRLGFQGIVDLVGDKLRDVFATQDISITWYDEPNNLLHYMYAYEHGKRLTVAPKPPVRNGMFETMRRTREPYVVASRSDPNAHGGSIPGTDSSKSVVAVPIVSNDRTLGQITLENYERENAFGEADVRLLQTIAASLGTALENARLFDETQRLLKETEQRHSELAVINKIQEGMAAELDFQAIVDMVGDKLREVFRTGDIGISWYDDKANLMHALYAYEHGVALNVPPVTPKPGGPTERILRTRAIVVANTLAELRATGIEIVPGTDQSLAMVRVPIVASDRVLGTMQLENYEREHAFGAAEVRLLSTIAASMGVALENARLFNETQRLLKETEQRNAELAIINSVQAALAAEINIQGIYDAVGDKIREIFGNRDVGIRIYDPKTNIVHFPYTFENGERVSITSRQLLARGFTRHVIDTREPLVINERMEEISARYGSLTIAGTADEKSAAYVPLIVGDRARGLISLLDTQREHAFSDSDVRLLQTLANSMSVALENARLFDETQRLLKETEQRAAELAVISRIQEGMAAELDFQAIIDLVGDKLREVFKTGDIGIRWYDAKANLTQFLYEYEHGVRLTPPSVAPPPEGLFFPDRADAPPACCEQPRRTGSARRGGDGGHRPGPLLGQRSHRWQRPRTGLDHPDQSRA